MAVVLYRLLRGRLPSPGETELHELATAHRSAAAAQGTLVPNNRPFRG